jgi:hypothetical protein
MTMKDNKCDVCGRPGAVGVASTAIPYSCAYCVPCLQVNAQPDIVFETIWEGSDGDNTQIHPAYLELVTWKDGKYIDYPTWSAERKQRA